MADDDLRKRAEAAIQEKAIHEVIDFTSEDVAAKSPQEMAVILHDLRVHQIELEMQNAELRKVQLELDESRADHLDFFDFAPAGYCTVSKDGLILRGNFWISNQFAVQRRSLMQKRWSSFILRQDQDIWYAGLTDLLTRSVPMECQLRMLKGDGSLFWAHLSGTINKAGAIAVVIVDVSNLKAVEEQLTQAKIAADAARIAKGEF
jgi:PAS domain-containing protein